MQFALLTTGERMCLAAKPIYKLCLSAENFIYLQMFILRPVEALLTFQKNVKVTGKIPEIFIMWKILKLNRVKGQDLYWGYMSSGVEECNQWFLRNRIPQQTVYKLTLGCFKVSFLVPVTRRQKWSNVQKWVLQS